MSGRSLVKTGVVLIAGGLIGGMVWIAFMIWVFNTIRLGYPDEIADAIRITLIGAVGGASLAIIGAACIVWGLVSRHTNENEQQERP